MKLSFPRIVFTLAAMAWGQVMGAEPPASTGGLVIDSCAYANNAAAAAAWEPMYGTRNAEAATVDGQAVLRLPCVFKSTHEARASWDKRVSLDLSKASGIQFKLLCRNPLPVTYFSIYLKSGDGWYEDEFYPDSRTNWNVIRFDKAALKKEGKPGGWDHIETIRVSAWRGKNVDTEFYLSDLRATEALPPPTPRDLAEMAIKDIADLASFPSFEAATNAIGQSTNAPARKALAAAVADRQAALDLARKGSFAAATDKANAAREQLLDAYCLAQKPQAGELRGFWCHDAFGVRGQSWDEAIRKLSENGFNAIFPNMLWGGVAFYPSDVLPVAPQVAERGDQIAECLAACRKYGVQIHVWKVDWNLGHAVSKSYVEKMRAEHRLQRKLDGTEEPWLCPSHPENQKLEIAAMVEVVRKYDVDGIHFDYIRYPGIEYCFCDGCRERFQRASGLTVKNWPRGILTDDTTRDKWNDWRRGNITTVVRSVSEQARAIKPKIKLSAAVYRNWIVDRDGVAQDWKVWCDKGYLDFVCPMDYTANNGRFEAMVSQQVEWAGKTPCYPGLGVSASSSRFGPDRAIEQINITRRYGTHGFLIFNYGVKESRDILPKLGLGITAKEP
jgi:uncharacterized lipoprotein YddW (UPF0748 family)